MQNSDTGVYEFKNKYENIPAVVASSGNDSENLNFGDVNIYIEKITKFYVKIGVSDKLTGTVNIQVVGK